MENKYNYWKKNWYKICTCITNYKMFTNFF